jgi:transcriptional regulator with XRE-family HTH domain
VTSYLTGRVGITFQQLQKYESAANRVSASRLWDMAEVLGASVESFLPPATPARPGRAWTNDPDFARWVRLYHDTPRRKPKGAFPARKSYG